MYNMYGNITKKYLLINLFRFFFISLLYTINYKIKIIILLECLVDKNNYNCNTIKHVNIIKYKM